MKAPASNQRRAAEKRRLRRAAAPRRFIPTVFVLLALAVPLSARAPRQPAIPTLPAPTSTGPTSGEPSLKRLLFGIGVGFERFAGAQGVSVTRVLPDSPASRAGLVVGCVVTEINGVVTTGRSGEDCAKIIQSTFGPVRVKFVGADQQEKTLQLRKTWLPMPEYRVFSP
jgi:S1-C subfamily serine protease